MAESVKVAVRVRPFNQRETNANSTCVISMVGQSTTIVKPNDTDSKKMFMFDHSYWSHDGFKTSESGVSVPDSSFSKYADQQRVFDDLGQGVLDNAWSGYNAALFAYGQTGSGKSYSMIGYGANRGIVPIICSELFRIIEERKASEKQFQVTYSMLEIYNEQVRDLLVSTRGLARGTRGGLRVRQHPREGFYCEGLKQVPVRSYVEIDRLMGEGVVNRTTASTSMNATSSRSHMVITIGFKQIFLNELGQSTTKTSEISLVDLAGSERAASTEATGDRLKEGSAINTSLLTLGNVIHALAESGNKTKKVNIPYRNSVLTKLLQSALGGNSKTIMIAALSPAAINYEETLSTLRYADRAKQIQTRAVVNESLTDKLIRELKSENERLLEQLRALQAGGGQGDKAFDLEKLLRENERQMRETEQSWEQRLEDARSEWERSHDTDGGALWRQVPYITNINEDPQLSGVIKLCLAEGDSILGKPGTIEVTIELRGLGIQNNHAIIRTKKQKASITPGSEQAAIMLNGKRVKGKTKLKHLDRLKLGSNNLYIYVGFPSERAAEKNELEPYTYDFFQTELAEKAGLSGQMLAGSDDIDPAVVKVFQEFIDLLPKITEVNAMAEDLKKGVTFEAEVKNLATHDALGRAKSKEVILRVVNSSKKIWYWSSDKFTNRKFMMEDIYHRWMDGESENISQDEDPFWDPPEDIFIGSVHVWLAGLAYCMESDDHLEIRNYRGKEEGQLHVQLAPSDPSGKTLLEEVLVLDPDEMLGRQLDFTVSIPEASALKWVQADQTRGAYCRFNFYNQPSVHSTRVIWGSVNPRFTFRKHLSVRSADHHFLNYLQAHALVIELWGCQVGEDGTYGSADMDLSGSASEMALISLRERLQRQEKEVASLRRDQAMLQNENTRLHRLSMSVPKILAPKTRRVAVTQRDAPFLNQDQQHQAPASPSHLSPQLLKPKSAMLGRRPSSGARRKHAVFLPAERPQTLHTEEASSSQVFTFRDSRKSSVAVVDLPQQTMPPIVTPITPGPRPPSRKASLSRPPSPDGLAAASSVSSPRANILRISHPPARRPSTTPALEAREAEPPGLDTEVARALKNFFKDMKGVQNKIQDIKELGLDAQGEENSHLKTILSKQQSALNDLDNNVNTSISHLREIVLSLVRKHKEATSS